MRVIGRASAAALMIGCILSAPGFAQQTDEQQKKKAFDPNEVVCERQQELGSRLGSKRICKTRAEWAEERRLDRMEIDRVQTQRGSCENC
jgi:hypothetical protein